MDFAYDTQTEELRKRLLDFMDEWVYPAEAVFAEQVARSTQAGDHWRRPPVIAELKEQARSRGLWNLFLAHNESGAGLTNQPESFSRFKYQVDTIHGPKHLWSARAKVLMQRTYLQ